MDSKKEIGEEVPGVKILGRHDRMSDYFNSGIKKASISFGSIGDVSERKFIFKELKEIGFELPIIVDGSAVLAKSVILGEGTFVGKNVVINSCVVIGSCCTLNTSSIIEHDCKTGDFVHVAPGCVLYGEVNVESDTHIGPNTTIINNLKVGENSMIGAGSVVVKNINANVKAFGNPCKER